MLKTKYIIEIGKSIRRTVTNKTNRTNLIADLHRWMYADNPAYPERLFKSLCNESKENNDGK